MPVLAEYHVIDFRQIHWLRGNIPFTCCREQKAAFCQLEALTLSFCCVCERSTIILVEMFSDVCCLEDNAPGTVRQTQWLDPFNRDRRCDRWVREEDMLKRWVIFTF